MANVLHAVNSFDPSCAVVRAVRELNLYSRHRHRLRVRNRHPLQDVYRFEEAAAEESADALLAWCDAIIYQFVGWEFGPDDRRKPAAFRNINVYWDATADRFWSAPDYNARSFDRYRLLASSHVGARDFLPADGRFRWLPDLIPLDGAYAPGPEGKAPCVSYIKHREALEHAPLRCASMNHDRRPHAEVMGERRERATIAVDNVSDGHYGLSGLETMAMGLPTVVFNHPQTRAALTELAPGDYPPFLECGRHVKSAVGLVNGHYADAERGRASRAWMEKWYAPQRIVQRYWDPFVDELLAV